MEGSPFPCGASPGPGRSCFKEIPGGTFLMGAQATESGAPGYDEHAEPHEGPPHRVTVGSFRIMRFEASIDRFLACVRAGWCDTSDAADPFVSEGLALLAADPASLLPDRPVTGLSWEGALRLCGWLGGRLPTEAEWEWVARGEDGRPFPWGTGARCGRRQSVSVGNAEGCAQERVGEYAELSDFGPFDVIGQAGSVWEWTSDRYGPYAAGDVTDPRGPASGASRVQRGGGWLSSEVWELRSAARGALAPDRKLPDVGVRCAMDAP